MKKLCQITAEGLASGEMKHGAGARIGAGVSVVLLAPVDSLHEADFSAIAEVKARVGRVIAITDAPAALRGTVDCLVSVPSTHPAFFPFVSVIPLQLLAYHLAVVKGHNAGFQGGAAERPQEYRTSALDPPGHFFPI